MTDQLRAIFVAFHLIAITAVAFPAPVGMRRSDLESADVQAAIKAWQGLASALGVADEPDAFQEWLWLTGTGLLAARNDVLEPLQPYYRYSGTQQSWSMFGTINHTPARLEIHIDHGSGWEPLFIARTRDHDWRARQLDQERLRGLINPFSWRRDRTKLRKVADWVARLAADDFPQARRIRLRMVVRPLPDPAELRAAGELTHSRAYWPELRELK